MERDSGEPPYSIVEVKRKAENYIASLPFTKRREVVRAMAKIEENPYRDQKRWAIRHLHGRLEGLWEYKGIHSLRIIYEIINRHLRQIIVRQVVPHL